jgi:hypothetical protein
MNDECSHSVQAPNPNSSRINFQYCARIILPFTHNILFQGMMSTSTESSNKPSRTQPNTPTSRLARSAITSRQLFEESGEERERKRYDDSMSATLLGSPMASATTMVDEFAGELPPPPPSSPAISHAEVMEHLDESNFTFRKSHAGVLTLRQQEKVDEGVVVNILCALDHG